MDDDFLAALEGAASRAKKKPRQSSPPEKRSTKPPQRISEPPSKPAESLSAKQGGGEVPQEPAAKSPVEPPPSRNASRLTCYLFENDVRALAGIRERLESVGHDFVNRSDAIKVALRLAAKTKPEQLSKVLQEVKREDMRFKASKK